MLMSLHVKLRLHISKQFDILKKTYQQISSEEDTFSIIVSNNGHIGRYQNISMIGISAEMS